MIEVTSAAPRAKGDKLEALSEDRRTITRLVGTRRVRQDYRVAPVRRAKGGGGI